MMDEPSRVPATAAFPDVDAVVIGASAGGVEALKVLLQALGPAFAPPVLVVLHRPAGCTDTLVSLLARYCRLPVAEALDKQPVQAATVLFAPSDYHLLVEPGRTLALSLDEPVLHSRPAIDPLFESAAQAFGPRLLAIVLTGASRDGSEGLATVRRCGGVAWVQDPATAFAATMPGSALARAGADAVLSLADMAFRLSRAGTA